jgi:hypothetical protein
MVMWLNKIEFYPFTAWQMYTNPPRGPVVYFRPFAIDESGMTSAAYFEDAIPVLRGHYVGVLESCFRRSEAGQCHRFLDAAAAAYNAGARPGRRVVGFEIQRWRWDTRTDAANRTPGRLAATLVYRPKAIQAAGRRVH